MSEMHRAVIRGLDREILVVVMPMLYGKTTLAASRSDRFIDADTIYHEHISDRLVYEKAKAEGDWSTVGAMEQRAIAHAYGQGERRDLLAHGVAALATLRSVGLRCRLVTVERLSVDEWVRRFARRYGDAPSEAWIGALRLALLNQQDYDRHHAGSGTVVTLGALRSLPPI